MVFLLGSKQLSASILKLGSLVKRYEEYKNWPLAPPLHFLSTSIWGSNEQRIKDLKVSNGGAKLDLNLPE